MITKPKKGDRVRYQSLDDTLDPEFGSIVHVLGKRYAVRWDADGEEYTYTAGEPQATIYPIKR